MAQRGFVSSGGGEDFDSLEVDRVEVVGNAPIGFLIEQVACNQSFQDCQDCLFRSLESFSSYGTPSSSPSLTMSSMSF